MHNNKMALRNVKDRVAIIPLVVSLTLSLLWSLLWQLSVSVPPGSFHEQRETIVNKMLVGCETRIRTQSDVPLKAILHVGPHKTGTSTVQSFLYSNKDALMKDGFILPQFTGTHRGSKNVANLGNCLAGRDQSLNCTHIIDVQMIAFLDKAKKTRKNVLFSAEAFSREEVDWERLIGLLHGFDIEVVLVYRRFYDYLRSMYSQANKFVRRRYRESGMKGVLAAPTIPEFVTSRTLQMYSRQHSVRLYQRAKNRTLFSTDYLQTNGKREGCRSNNNLVRVYNWHRSGEFLPQFICQLESMLPNTCRRARKQTSDTVVNKGFSLAGDFVLARAHEQGLFNYERILRGGETRFETLRQQVEIFIQSCATDATGDPFYYTCLDDQQNFETLTVSKELEESMLQLAKGEADDGGMAELNDLQADFQNSQLKFCSMNATNFLTKYGSNLRSILPAKIKRRDHHA